jgi:hypothetical protein
MGWVSPSVCHARGKASRHRMSPGLCSFGPMLPIAETVGCFDIEIYGTKFGVDAIARWSSIPVASLLCIPPLSRTQVTSVLLLTQIQSSRQESADGGASYAESHSSNRQQLEDVSLTTCRASISPYEDLSPAFSYKHRPKPTVCCSAYFVASPLSPRSPSGLLSPCLWFSFSYLHQALPNAISY